MSLPISWAEFEIPHRLRAIVRARESSLIVLAALGGACAGLVVVGMGICVEALHTFFFELPPGARLSARISIDPRLAFTVPTLGGLSLGLAMVFIARRRPGREVDPIEANALHGGRMSLIGSLLVAAQTVWSSGCGASVGLEAGYTQLGSAISSRIGRAFRLRRGDLRILVGCGAAAAIAGAFGAPLAGAFYAFELVIGAYTIASLAPVGIAALIGYMVAQSVAPTHLGIVIPQATTIGNHDLIVAAGLGLFSAILGIVIMRGVAACESLVLWLRVPLSWRPALGGIVVGALALISPQVMSSGHGALHLTGVLDLPLRGIALLLVLKALASIVSLGSGFRGGLFFASLLLGALAGHLFAAGLTAIWQGTYFDPNAYAVIGMGALSATVIGGPLTMIFIALESTGNLWLTTAVLVAVIIATQVTRETFGYSFATWRFHLRGETIRSAADIGWMRDLTVGRMMRRDVETWPADTSIADFRKSFPPGSTGQVATVDKQGRYAGLVLVPEAHMSDLADALSIREILHLPEEMLVASMTVQQAIATFDRTEAEALAVVDSDASRRVIGLLTEAHALRRYSAELERRRRDLLGET